MAYVYPAEMRPTRDLLRRRMFFKHKRAELLGHIQNTRHQYLLPAFEKSIAHKRNRQGIVEHFPNQTVQKSVQSNLELISTCDHVITDLELYISGNAKEHNPNDYYQLRSVPGIGKVLALVILSHRIGRSVYFMLKNKQAFDMKRFL